MLELKNLGKDYTIKRNSVFQPKNRLVAVDHINIRLKKNSTLGLVGESGCGKSTLGRLICRLEEPSRGEIYLDGQAIHNLKGTSLRRIRRKFQPVFQDPYGSLNPRLTVYRTLEEPLRLHDKPNNKNEINNLLEMVGLGNEVMGRYPHQLSGGQRQRLGLARALAVGPELIIADEPVSSLDVSIQAQILNLFLDLQERLHLSMIFISHDLRVVGQLADEVAVMYLGRIMELAPANEIFSNAKHPYTQALLEALPKLKPGRGRLRSILKGELPSPVNPAPGCRFYSRCKYAGKECLDYENELFSIDVKHIVACCKWHQLQQNRKYIC